jgi:hypothetical protein
VGEQEAGQSGAIAAGALDRPASLAWDLCPGEVQQGVVAAGVGAGLGLGDDPPDRGDSGGGEGARGGCRRRRAPSTVSARMAMRLLLGEGGRGRCRPGSSVTARRNCDGSRPFGSDRLLIRPASGGPGRHRHHGRQLSAKATHPDASRISSHAAVPVTDPASDPPGPQAQHSQLHLAISTLGALHLEARTPHTAFTIGLFEPFSRPSEWSQPPLRYSSVTPSARCNSALMGAFACRRSWQSGAPPLLGGDRGEEW